MMDYIRNRSVAIVGPSVISEGEAEEIDAHDIVVRFNSTSDDIGERRGDKIDVVYCTGAVTKKIAEGKLGHPDTADWLVSRASEGVSEIHDSGSIHARMAILQNVFFHGVPNMVPLALFDILNFSPSRVSIYGTNLYISSRLYSDDYVTDNKSVTSARMVQSFASHDSLANFKFMKNMFELGYFDPSQQLEAVLQNTDREYMRLLKRLHVEQKPVELEHV